MKDVILNDGTSIRLRPISPDDDEKMLRLFDRLSPSTIYARFFGMVPRFSDTEIQRFTHIDFNNELAIVGTVFDEVEPEGEKLVAVGRYIRLPTPTHAEVALTVEDAYQSHGIGTLLLGELLYFACHADIKVLEAEVLAENTHMLHLFNHLGLRTTSSFQGGVVHIEVPLEERCRTWIQP